MLQTTALFPQVKHNLVFCRVNFLAIRTVQDISDTMRYKLKTNNCCYRIETMNKYLICTEKNP